MVTPYAPYRDGIATYSVQEVRQRQINGENIEVLSPLPSAAHHHLALGGLRGVLALIKRSHKYKKMVIQFYPELLFGRSRGRTERYLTWKALRVLCARLPVEIRVHEINYGLFKKNFIERRAARKALKSAEAVYVHTQAETIELTQQLGLRAGLVKLFTHGEFFNQAADLTQDQARKDLDLPADEHIFLCIGFVQEHKGFDQAVRAFNDLNTDQAKLYIVGSTRVDAPELIQYSNKLQSLVDSTDNCVYKSQYVSDYEFDAWIIAADTVLVPYREIWSSGVLERAKLYGKKVIASDVGGLGDQADESTALYTEYPGLVKAMKLCLPHVSDQKVSKAEATSFDLVEAQNTIRERAKSRKQSQNIHTNSKQHRPVSDLENLPTLKRPEPVSPSRSKSKIKSFVYRLINWQIDPVEKHVGLLQNSTETAVQKLQDRIKTLEDKS